MHFVVICKDKADPALRLAARADHIEFVAGQQDKIVYAGPLLEQGRMIGSIFIFDVPDRAAIEAYCTQDPYFIGGVFETVDVYESRWLVPEKVPGSLAAEAAKARTG